MVGGQVGRHGLARTHQKSRGRNTILLWIYGVQFCAWSLEHIICDQFYLQLYDQLYDQCRGQLQFCDEFRIQGLDFMISFFLRSRGLIFMLLASGWGRTASCGSSQGAMCAWHDIKDTQTSFQMQIR